MQWPIEKEQKYSGPYTTGVGGDVAQVYPETVISPLVTLMLLILHHCYHVPL